jgi:Rrf2 family protein
LTILVKDLGRMLKINRRTDYAVRVILALAKRPEGTRLPTQVIQREMLVPRAFLQRIIADLSKTNLIETFSGPSGGIQLTRPVEAITLRTVYEAIEGPLVISDCLQGPGECPLDTGCPVRPCWSRLQSMIVDELENISMKQLALEANQTKT